LSWVSSLCRCHVSL